MTDAIKNTSENTSKTISDNKNKKPIENINEKKFEIRNDRGILASYLISPSSKITNPENTTQFKLVKDHNSNRVNDLLKNKSLPINLHNSFLTFRDTKTTI